MPSGTSIQWSLRPAKLCLKPKSSSALIWFSFSFLECKCTLSWNWWRQHQSTCIYARLHRFLFCQLILMYWKWESTCLYTIWLPKSTNAWKSKSSEDKWIFMKYNPNSGCMNQSRHNIFKQNAHLIKKLAKKCHPLGLPSQQSVDNNRVERGRECI